MFLDNMKSLLTPRLIVAHPCEEGTFSVHTDAGTIGIGSVLFQEPGAVEKVIGYYSTTLPKTLVCNKNRTHSILRILRNIRFSCFLTCIYCSELSRSIVL